MKYFFLFLLLFYSVLIIGQDHEHHKPDTIDHSLMAHSFSLSLPMNKNGSGTGWLPSNSPMYGYMEHRKNWMFMFHGNLFLRYNIQDIFKAGTRGGSKIDAPNWLMFMGQRKVGKNGLFHFSSMFSLDPLTVGGAGYPLLFQTGETWQGQALIDRQHPHDLFSELSVSYAYRINKETDVFAYLAYPGEPALGMVAFMHRISALDNPDAPLGHHWQDATHITFGVATVGFRYSIFKIEGSLFTGREPDEDRYGFDSPSFDSWSGRISASPMKSLVLQLSHAYLAGPEANRPGENIYRTTTSAIHQLQFMHPEKHLASSLYWGLNQSDHSEHSIGAEFSLRLKKQAVYGRYEWIQKDAEELNLHMYFNNQHLHEIVEVNAITLGTNRTILERFQLRTAIGLQSTLYISGETASLVYGKAPVALEVYLRIYPSLMEL